MRRLFTLPVFLLALALIGTPTPAESDKEVKQILIRESIASLATQGTALARTTRIALAEAVASEAHTAGLAVARHCATNRMSPR
jgi:hypothetical protein